MPIIIARKINAKPPNTPNAVTISIVLIVFINGEANRRSYPSPI